MDDNIILDRGRTSVMKLDADEQALMDEIEISVPKPKPVQRPQKTSYGARPPVQHQEAMDAFVNPHKQSAPTMGPAGIEEEESTTERMILISETIWTVLGWSNHNNRLRATRP